jgi:hypothetical protein
MVADRSPFGTAYYSNVLDRENGEEEVFVGPVIPILVHLRLWAARDVTTSLSQQGQSGTSRVIIHVQRKLVEMGAFERLREGRDPTGLWPGDIGIGPKQAKLSSR